MSATQSAGVAEPTPAAAVPESTPVTATSEAAAGTETTTTTSKASKSGAGGANKTATPSTATETKENSVVETVKRFIPGLKSKDEQAQASAAAALKSKRSRGSKAAKKVNGQQESGDVAGASDPALATATLDHAPRKDELPAELQASSNTTSGKPRPAGLNGTTLQADDEANSKRFSAVGNIQKRLRANNKKLQKLATYEAQSTPLNADQKKSLEQKPVLEAIQRELTDVSKSLELEEADEEKRAARRKTSDDAQVQHKIAAAVNNQKLASQNDLSLLLQFLHLYSLFTSSTQGQYANATIPPVVTNATPQQHAAVHALFYNLANGPLVGSAGSSGDDAISQIQNLQSGSEKSVVDGVSFADVKQMILDLTAGPAEMGHELPAGDAIESSTDRVAEQSSFETAPVPIAAQETGSAEAGAGDLPSGLNFMQVSEIESRQAQQAASQQQQYQSIESEIPVHTTVNEVGSNAATPGGVTPAVEKSNNGWEAPAGLTAGSLPVAGSGWADEPVAGAVKNWADDVDESAPADPFTSTPDVPAELKAAGQYQQQSAPPAVPGVTVDADGFIQNTNGRGGRGNRGALRGARGRGGRGRGDFRGGERRQEGSGADGEWRRIPSSGDGVAGGPQRNHRGGGRGGRGGEHRGERTERGDYRGRGRGRGGAPVTAAAEA